MLYIERRKETKKREDKKTKDKKREKEVYQEIRKEEWRGKMEGER